MKWLLTIRCFMFSPITSSCNFPPRTKIFIEDLKLFFFQQNVWWKFHLNRMKGFRKRRYLPNSQDTRKFHLPRYIKCSLSTSETRICANKGDVKDIGWKTFSLNISPLYSQKSSFASKLYAYSSGMTTKLYGKRTLYVWNLTPYTHDCPLHHLSVN